MFELLDQPEVQVAINEAFGEAVGEFGHDLSTKLLGGEQLACTASVVRRTDGQVRIIVQPRIIGLQPETERQAFLLFLATQQRQLSERTPTSTRFIIAMGGDQTGHFGSAVLSLDHDGMYYVAVGCAGLAELVSESYADLIAANIKRRLVLLQAARGPLGAAV